MELDDKIYAEIQKHTQRGDEWADQGDYPSALAEYWKAYDLLPEPKTDWEAATWILAAIGDAHFLENDFQAGVDNLTTAMHCPDAIGNPFLHLRLGQCQFEIGNKDQAADELTRAYALEGARLFDDENPKYLAFLRTRMKPEEERKKPWWKF